MAKTLQVKADIIADTASYVAGVKRATAATDKFGRATRKAGSKNAFKGIGRSAIAATAGVVSLYGAYSQGKKAIDATTKLAKGTLQLQRVTNLSARDASRFAAVLQERGIEANKASVSFTALSKQIVAAQGGTVKAADAFKKLGVSQQLIKKGDTQAVLLKAADGLSKMGAGAQRTALAAQLFGKGYKDLLPLLLLGSKGISEQTALAGKLGAEFSGSSLSSAKQYIAAQREMKTTTLGLRVALGTALMPALTTAMHAITGFVLGVRDGTGAGGVFRDNIKGIGIALAGLGAVLAAGKIAGSLTSIGSLLASVFSNPYTAAIAAVAIGIAAIGTAFYLAYTRSKSLQKLVAEIGATVGPIFKTVGDEAKRELPGALAAAGRVARSMTRLFVALKPVIVPIFKAIAAVASTNLRGIGPVLNFVSKRINALTQTTKVLLRSSSSAFKGVASAASKMSNMIGSAFNAIKAAVSRVLSAVRGTVSAFRSVGRDIVNGLASGIRGAAGTAIQAAQDLANALPKWARKVLGISSPSKVFAEIGRNAGRGLVVGLMATLPAVRAAGVAVANAASFGVGDELAVGTAQRNAGMARTKGGKRRTAATLRNAERTQRFNEAKGTLQTFINSLVDKIKSAKLAEIMAPVDKARNKRAADEYASSKVSLTTQIARAQADANNPKAQERYQREAARLDARIQAARAAGNLEAEDALQSEKDALDARYGPAYLTGLQDQLAQLNENEIERTSEAAATAFAETFRKGFDSALTQLLNGGTVEQFFKRIGQTLGGSGVAPGDTKDISGGAGTAAGTVAPSGWASRFSRYFKNKPKGSFAASAIGATIGASQAAVYAHRRSAPAGYKIQNKASGGLLTPGALTLVGETGPELIVGGKVNSATRTSRMGGGVAGMNITINAHGAAANDPVLLARELGWQLATR